MIRRALQVATIVAIAATGTLSLLAAQEKDKSTSDESPHYRVKEILGSKVSLEGNTAAGTVDDIVLDENGNVDYLIVINNDKKLVTVPWDAATFDVKKRT